MEHSWEISAFIVGPLSIVALVARSMISIDRSLKERQARAGKKGSSK